MGGEKERKDGKFTPENQPKKRGAGRPKNVFGPLSKANNLTNDDVRKIFKNLLSSNPNEMNKVVEKYPTVLTVAAANMITQELKGELTGKFEKIKRTVPTDKTDEAGNIIMETEYISVPERKRSFETVKYMIDRCFGKPMDVAIVASISEESEQRILQIFSETFEESDLIEPLVIAERIEHIEADDADG